MPTYTIPLPAGTDTTNPLLPDRLAAYFTGKGYTVLDGAAILSNGTALITLDRDPSADAAGFANQPTAAEQSATQAWTVLTAYLAAVKKIAPANRTPEQRALLAILRVLANMQDAG